MLLSSPLIWPPLVACVPIRLAWQWARLCNRWTLIGGIKSGCSTRCLVIPYNYIVLSMLAPGWLGRRPMLPVPISYGLRLRVLNRQNGVC